MFSDRDSAVETILLKNASGPMKVSIRNALMKFAESDATSVIVGAFILRLCFVFKENLKRSVADKC